MFRRVETVGSRLARHRFWTAVFVGLFAFVLNAALAALSPTKEPLIHDELSYLLAADTFAHGRATNPTHPMWVHFETMHVLQKPTYMSKYPPGQGLILAAGKVLGGDYVVGLWLSACLACTATCWMLQAWVPPRYALLGGLLVACHTVVLDWGERFWGGLLPLTGGSLLLGGMKRAMDRPCVGAAFAIGLGMSVLAVTRPYEGATLSLVCLAVLALSRVRRDGVLSLISLGFLMLGAAPPLFLTVVGIAYYDYKVTGHPAHLPYVLYEANYASAPVFLFQSRPAFPPEFRNQQMKDFDDWTVKEYNRQKSQGFFRSAGEAVIKAASAFFPIFNPIRRIWWKGLWETVRNLPLVLLQLPLLCLPCMAFARATRLSTILLAASVVIFALPTWRMPHYLAPVLGLVLVLTLRSVRVLSSWTWGYWRIGRATSRLLLLIYFLWPIFLFVILPAIKPDKPLYWRSNLSSKLMESGANHLVVVRYGHRHDPHEEWVYNSADIDNSPIVWARDLGEEQNRHLLAYYKSRRAWLFEPDLPGKPLVSFPGSNNGAPISAVQQLSGSN